jgi:hypothetical protein
MGCKGWSACSKQEPWELLDDKAFTDVIGSMVFFALSRLEFGYLGFLGRNEFQQGR